MKQTVFKTGNSLAVTIPADFVNTLGIKSGDQVKSVAQLGKNRITYIFPQSLQLSFLSERKIKPKRKNLTR